MRTDKTPGVAAANCDTDLSAKVLTSNGAIARQQVVFIRKSIVAVEDDFKVR